MSKKTSVFDSSKGKGDVNPSLSGSFIDGTLEVDETIKPIGRNEIAELMRAEAKTMKPVMEEVMNSNVDRTNLDI